MRDNKVVKIINQAANQKHFWLYGAGNDQNNESGMDEIFR